MDCGYTANGQTITLHCPEGTLPMIDPSWLDWAPTKVGLAFLAGLVILLIARSFFRICDQWDRAVILRLGKFQRVAGPGIILKIPLIETIAEWVSLQTEVTHVAAEKSLTKDTVPVTVKAVIYWRVVDPKAAVVNVDDFSSAIETTAQVALREAVGSHDFTELLSQRDSVDLVILNAVQRKTHDWGLDVTSVDIQDVVIPDDLQNAMSQEAQAERESHARAILGSSEAAIAQNFVEAAKIYSDHPMALTLRKMNIIYEIQKDKGATILLPTEMLEVLGSLGKK